MNNTKLYQLSKSPDIYDHVRRELGVEFKGNKMPKMLQGTFCIEGIKFWVLSSYESPTPIRIFVTCPKCKHTLPAGRVGQHICRTKDILKEPKRKPQQWFESGGKKRCKHIFNADGICCECGLDPKDTQFRKGIRRMHKNRKLGLAPQIGLGSHKIALMKNKYTCPVCKRKKRKPGPCFECEEEFHGN